MIPTEGLVSVIIPTYKGSDKIATAVDSVLSQTYKDIEAIVVDDNGIGTAEQIETEKVIEKYKNVPNFKYIPHEVNKNGSAARNTGIRQAKGEYLCFLDDDDEYLPDKVKIQIEALSKLDKSYGMLVGSVKVIENGYESISSGVFEGDFLYQYLCHETSACSSTVMIRANVIDVVKEWDESFKRHQDWEFFARVADSFQAAYVDDIGVVKNKYDNNLPKDGETAEKYRTHYLNKMRYIIEKYPKSKQKKIYFNNWVEVGKVYLKNKNIADAVRIAFKAGNLFCACKAYLMDGIRFAKKKKAMNK